MQSFTFLQHSQWQFVMYVWHYIRTTKPLTFLYVAISEFLWILEKPTEQGVRMSKDFQTYYAIFFLILLSKDAVSKSINTLLKTSNLLYL